MDCNMPGFLSFTNSQSLLKLMSTESLMPSNHLVLYHPPLLLPSIFPSIRVFSNEPALCIRWPKYCNFNFSVSASNEYSGLISFRMDWVCMCARLVAQSCLTLCDPMDCIPPGSFVPGILQGRILEWVGKIP